MNAKRYMVALTLFTVLLTSGCASNADRPDEMLASARTSIEFAEESGARQFGDIALNRARQNLQQAERAADEGEFEEAKEFAHAAQLDAELAASQANRHKAEIALEEVNESIATLRREIDRNIQE